MEGLTNNDAFVPQVPESLAQYKTDFEKYLDSLGSLKIEYIQSKQPEVWAAAVSLAGASLAAITAEEKSSK